MTECFSFSENFQMKRMATTEVFHAASSIAERVMSENSDLRQPKISQPKINNSVCIANFVRQRLRSEEPENFDFDVSDQ